MVTKGVFIAVFFLWGTDNRSDNSIKEPLGTLEDSEAIIRLLLLLGGLLIIPNFLFSLISICCSTGFNKKLSQVILAYPAAWMLPIATYFVIGPQNLSCCSKTNAHKYHLGFSKPYTIINIILALMMYAAIISITGAAIVWGEPGNIPFTFIPALFLSLIFNIIFLSSDLKCCCSCCCDYDCREHETYVIATNTEKLDIVKIDD